MKKKFDPTKWLNGTDILELKDSPQGIPTPKVNPVKSDTNRNDIVKQIELVVQKIEASALDITANYAHWRDIGFGLADALGEAGRTYFHRVSTFYPEYNPHHCDRQFDYCLNGNREGVTIRTFFHLAKQAGIDIFTKNIKTKTSNIDVLPNIKDSKTFLHTPRLPSTIYSSLPTFLKEPDKVFQDPVEKDVFLIGTLSALSGCLPNVVGTYFDVPYSPHIYSFVTAPAASGKGILRWAKQMGQRVHDHYLDETLKEKDRFEVEMENYNNLSKSEKKLETKPLEPKQKLFYIPANSSSSRFIQALADNDFRGVIFESEADTLANTFKQEWGNFSDILRKAFHHETVSLFRRKDNEFIEIKNPHLAIFLSGTPRQVHRLMPDSEDGLFSRFIYYAFEDKSEFKNPFLSDGNINFTRFFQEQAVKVFDLYGALNGLSSPIYFRLTSEQGRHFTSVFNQMLQRNQLLLGHDFKANIKRLGLITFRISMILNTLRIADTGDLSTDMVCDESDFNTAMQIATVLEKHAIAVFENLPDNHLNGKLLKFYEALPPEFNRQAYLSVGESLGIKTKAAEKYISHLKENKLLDHEFNNYRKKEN